MLHQALFAAGMLFAAGSLLASVYILLFAISGRKIGPQFVTEGEQIESPLFLVLIPAHNEAHGIQATIESAFRLNYPPSRFRVVTIADNCDDQTASVARACGSEVWERSDLNNRGKGQALAWAFERASQGEFDCAVIIDADTEIDPDFLRAMAAELQRNAAAEPCALQGRYEFRPSRAKAGWFETFTIASKAAENSYIYRPRSAARLVTLIQGNGFCLPRTVLNRVPFTASSVVEDAEYAITLALAGVSVRYVDAARVYSRMTRNIQDAAPQRLRWASGIFQLMVRSIPRLLGSGIVKRDWRLFEAALMLLLTSRLVVLYLTGMALLLALLLIPSAAAMSIGAILTATVLLQAVYLWMMFRWAGEKPFPVQDLLFVPVYLGIIGVTQIGALLGLRRKRWARTVR